MRDHAVRRAETHALTLTRLAGAASEEDREWAAKKGITIPSYHHERHARSAHADVGGGAEGVAAQAAAQKEQRVRGLCQTAQPACNGDSGSRSATKVLPFPQSLYQHFGIEGDPRAVPFEQRARVELSICKAANCLCRSHLPPLRVRARACMTRRVHSARDADARMRTASMLDTCARW